MWGGEEEEEGFSVNPVWSPPNPLTYGNGPSEALCPLAAGFAPIHPSSSTEMGGGTHSPPFTTHIPPNPHPPKKKPQNLIALPKKIHILPGCFFLLTSACFASPPLPPLHLPPSLSLGGKKVIAQMISQSSVAVATGCWNWDRRAARTTERSSISQGWGSPAFVFAFKSRGARRCEAPSSTPCVRPFHQQPPNCLAPVIKSPPSRCRRGVSTALAFLRRLLVWWHSPLLVVPSALERRCSGGAAVELGHVAVSSLWL